MASEWWSDCTSSLGTDQPIPPMLRTLSQRFTHTRASIAVIFAVAMLTATVARADSLTLAWDPNPEPEVVGYYVFIGTSSGVYSTVVDVGTATSYTFTATQPGTTYYMTVAAYVAGPIVGPHAPEVVATTGGGPTLSNPGTRSNSVGDSVALQLSASDPNGDAITFGAIGLPNGLSLNPSTGLISGTTTTAGTFTVSVTASDPSANITTQSFTWTVVTTDTAAPTIALTSPTTGSTYASTSAFLTLTGTAADDVGVSTVTWANSKGGSGTAAGTTSWSVVIPLSPGSNVITMTARDASNKSATITLTVSADPAAPSLAITTPTTAATYSTTSSSLSLAGTASDDVAVTSVTWTNSRGGSGTATGTTSWSATVGLQSGANTITVTAQDAAGHSTTKTLVASYDTAAPTLQITGPTSASTYSATSSSLTVSGTASDDIAVTSVSWTNSRGGSGTATGTSSWSAAIPVVAGSNTLTITARDAANRTTTATLTVSADPAAPTLAITSPTSAASYSTSTNSVTLGGTATDDVAVTTVTWSSSTGASGTATGTTNWTATVPLQLGTTTITVTAVDAAAHATTKTLTVSFQMPSPLKIVALTADKDAPQPSGTAITFTVTAQGGAAPNQFKWWLWDGASWSLVQDWSTSTSFRWVPARGNPSYRIGVWARSSINTSDTFENPDSTGTMYFEVTQGSAPPPLSLSALSSDKASPQVTGTTVTFSASASGGTSPYSYKWRVSNGSSWSVLRDWSTTASVSWAPSTPGTYQIEAWARNAGSTADAADSTAAVATRTFTVTAPPVALSPISANRTSPQLLGTSITFSTAGTSGTAPYSYKWRVSNGSTWTVLQNWSTSASATWTPSSAGSYQIEVWARSATSTADAPDASASDVTTTFVVSAGPLSVTSVTASKTSPQTTGTAVTFTAAATGGTAPYAYKWRVSNGSSWSVLQNWSSAASMTWTPTTAGIYQIEVWARSSGNTTDAAETTDADVVTNYTVTVPALVVSGISADRVSPQTPGTTVTLSASTSGGASPQFKWRVSDGSTWSVLRDWSTSTSASWTPSANGSYQVEVWARNGSTTADAPESSSADATLSFTIATPPLVVSAISINRVSPQTPNTTMVLTPATSGGLTPQYKWRINSASGWTLLRDWSTTAAASWTPTVDGSYQIEVWARNGSSTADAPDSSNADATTSFTIATPPLVVAGITADKATPQAPGTTVSLTTSASGGTAPYSYKWRVYNGSTWSVLRDWSTIAGTTWTPSTAGTYQVEVWVRSAGNTTDAAESSRADATVAYSIATPEPSREPLKVLGLTADKDDPQPTGAVVTFTAQTSGGAGPIQFKWWLWNGATWTLVKDWSTGNSLTWVPTQANPSYRIGVWARSATSTADTFDNSDSTGTMYFEIVPGTAPLALYSLSMDRPAPQTAGTPITFTVGASGGSGSIAYKWRIWNGSVWTTVQNWSTSSTFVWTPTSGASYQIEVWGRSGNSTDDAPDSASAVISRSYAISTAPASPLQLLALTADKTSPQSTSTTVTFTATASGGVPQYQYKWWLYDGTTWVLLRDWSSSSSYAWTPTLPAGSYRIGVWVRSATNSADSYDNSQSNGSVAFSLQ